VGLLSWVGGLAGRFLGTLGQDTINLVHWAVKGVVSVFGSVFHLVGRAWDDVGGATLNLARYVGDFVRAVWWRLRHLFLVVIPSLWRTLWRQVTRLIKLIDHWVNKLLAFLRALRAWAVREFNALRSWVVVHIYRPLLRSLTLAWHWIEHEGATVWFYISHPDKLAAFLFWHIVDALENNAWGAARRLGRFVMALFLANARRVALLLEDIVHAIL
jgi:hypothetical protein